MGEAQNALDIVVSQKPDVQMCKRRTETFSIQKACMGSDYHHSKVFKMRDVQQYPRARKTVHF